MEVEDIKLKISLTCLQENKTKDRETDFSEIPDLYKTYYNFLK